MIDFIKIKLPQRYADQIRRNPFLEFSSLVNLKHGDLALVEQAEFHGMKIVISPSQLIVSGSVHKFYNDYQGFGTQNYDDFTYTKLQESIGIIASVLNFEPQDAILQNLEYGLNLPLSKIPEDFLMQNLRSYRGSGPSQVNKFNNKGYYNEYTSFQYYLKVYSKSRQFGLDTPLLRLEVKTRKSCVVGKYGITKLSDLLELDKLDYLKHDLLRKLELLLIIDADDFGFIHDLRDREFLYRFINPLAVTSLSSNQKSYVKKKLIKMLDKYNLLETKKELVKKVREKWDDLMFS